MGSSGIGENSSGSGSILSRAVRCRGGTGWWGVRHFGEPVFSSQGEVVENILPIRVHQLRPRLKERVDNEVNEGHLRRKGTTQIVSTVSKRYILALILQAECPYCFISTGMVSSVHII